MTYQPTTITVHGKMRDAHIPAVILPSGRIRKLMDTEFYSHTVALDLAKSKVASKIYKPLKVPTKVDVNPDDETQTQTVKYSRPTPKGPATEFPTDGARLRYTPTIFAGPTPHKVEASHNPEFVTDTLGIRYETPDVHKTNESHGSLDHLGVPNAIPDQTPADVTAIELCRLFNVDRNLVNMQNKVDVNLEAHDLGRRAAMGGKGKRSCPFVKGGLVYYDWMEGFNSYRAGEAL